MFFYGCTNLSEIPTIQFSPSETFSTVSFSNAFYNCKKIKNLNKISIENTNNLTVTNLENMCGNCTGLITFPTFLTNSNILFQNNIKAQGCFENCSSLTGNIPAAFINNLSQISRTI
jgi:hypothetical protein